MPTQIGHQQSFQHNPKPITHINYKGETCELTTASDGNMLKFQIYMEDRDYSLDKDKNLVTKIIKKDPKTIILQPNKEPQIVFTGWKEEDFKKFARENVGDEYYGKVCQQYVDGIATTKEKMEMATFLMSELMNARYSEAELENNRKLSNFNGDGDDGEKITSMFKAIDNWQTNHGLNSFCYYRAQERISEAKRYIKNTKTDDPAAPEQKAKDALFEIYNILSEEKDFSPERLDHIIQAAFYLPQNEYNPETHKVHKSGYISEDLFNSLQNALLIDGTEEKDWKAIDNLRKVKDEIQKDIFNDIKKAFYFSAESWNPEEKEVLKELGGTIENMTLEQYNKINEIFRKDEFTDFEQKTWQAIKGWKPEFQR